MPSFLLELLSATVSVTVLLLAVQRLLPLEYSKQWTTFDYSVGAIFWFVWVTVVNQWTPGFNGPAKFWGWYLGIMIAYAIVRLWLPKRRQVLPEQTAAATRVTLRRDACNGPEDEPAWTGWRNSH